MNTYEIGHRINPQDAISTMKITAVDYSTAHKQFRAKFPRSDFLWSIRVGVSLPPDRRLPREDD